MQPAGLEKNLRILYWAMRSGIACIWLWTAVTSWFFYPHQASLAWLHDLGMINQAEGVFIAACLLDLAMGIATVLFGCRLLWQLQFATVFIYSLVIAIYLPHFLFHPFGPIVKNLAVLLCLAYLMLMDSSAINTSGEKADSPPLSV